MENYVGKRLDGRYEIQDVIGVGGMAVVYKAYDNIDDRIVAVKVLKDEYLANEEFRRRFKNESKAIAVLSHPNIVKVFDVSFGDRLQYIVMEYVEGITLKEYIEKRGVIDWNEALFFVIQILRALQHAHDKGIVHRDVKPQNIMLIQNGTIKVTDFGIARFNHSETRTVTEKAIGSVHYISPEQAKGEFTDEKADIYSVGIVLYEMLSGKLPFDGDNAVSIALMQVNSNPALPRTVNPDIPVGFEQITMKAMQKSTRERYQTAAEMLLDLEEFKRNPNIKFDYQTFFVDKSPTKPMGSLKDETRTMPAVNVKSYDSGTVKPIGVPPVRTKAVKIQDESEYDNNFMDQSPVEDVTKKSINNKTVAVVAGVAVALIVFIIILIFSMLKNGTITLGVGKKIEVNSFIGMNYEQEIRNNEEYEELYNFDVQYVSSTDREEGTVNDQDPKAGTKISKGATVKLFVVKAGEGQVIPDFAGQHYNQARDTLETMGFVVELIPTEDSEVVVGQVIKTEPGANETALAGADVKIYYAADTKVDKLFKMPNLEGKSLEEAERIIKESGLTLTKTETTDSTVEKDYVLNQSPEKGSPVSEGDSVILTVSSGFLSGEKTLSLPEAGVITVKVILDDTVIATEFVDSSVSNKYTVSVKGNKPDSKLQVYLDEALYYQAFVDFSRDDVKFSNEINNDVAFYVDVIGLDEIKAVEALNNAGYKNVTVEYEESFEKEGTVINQSPVKSSAPHLDKTASIVLTIAVGEIITEEDEELPEQE